MNATSTTDETYVRYMNVIAVDDDTKTITAMFGGAYSGNFSISLRHKDYGLVGTDGIILDVSASVTDYSPKTGSIYGGTLLTITGTNFGNVYTDNPVQIAMGTGNVDCFVQTTEATQITCRLDTGLSYTGGDEAIMIVFLKTSEEAICDPKEKCGWTWSSFIPIVKQAELQYDNDSQNYELKITGTDFTGDTSTVEFFIDNVKQTTKSVNGTEAIFTITDV